MQVYKTDSVGISHADNIYTYENDTIRVDYWFWAESGRMNFHIYNKSAKPIYIDLKKSSFIANSYKYNYWSDKTESTTLSSSISKSFTYRDSIEFPKVLGYSTIGGSIGGSVTKTSKPERITFLPPKSYIERYGKDDLLSDYYHFIDGDKNYTQKTDDLNIYDNHKTTITSKVFTRESSPLDFRNFLQFSFKEDFSQEFFVDNEFFIKELIVMDSRHFSFNKIIKKTGEYYEVVPYKRGIDFYKRAY